MNTYRKTAIIVGVLFITATVSSIIGYQVILGPLLKSPDYHINVTANQNQFLLGILIDSINSAAVVLIAVVLYPIIKKYDAALALGYVSSRIIESVILIVGSISLLSLLTLGQEYVHASASQASYFQTLGNVILGVNDWTYLLGPMIVFGLTALILNYIFYKSNLIPRFISVWGLIGGVLIILAGLLGMFGLSPFSMIVILLSLPIALNEMVLAIWLIVKGFNTSAIAAMSAKTDNI